MADQTDQTLGYYYGEEERGLLDPAWERQQKKVSTKFSNFMFFLLRGELKRR